MMSVQYFSAALIMPPPPPPPAPAAPELELELELELDVSPPADPPVPVVMGSSLQPSCKREAEVNTRPRRRMCCFVIFRSFHDLVSDVK
jgi:hypothetical protein